MIIGIPKEIKQDEYRVGITPSGVDLLSSSGHRVLIETGAGIGSGYTDDDYIASGADIIKDKVRLFKDSEMIIKVKEPLPSEYKLFKEGQIVFTYFHFSSNKELTQAMLDRKVISVAYETMETEKGELPLLAPMSEIAGKMAGQLAAQYLDINRGGSGKLIGGLTGVAPAKIVVIGAGSAGASAAKICSGMGGDVKLFDINIEKLKSLEGHVEKNIHLLYSSPHDLFESIEEADVIIGAVYIPGARAPKIISRKTVESLKPRTVIIDVCIDQGGCIETSRPTTHSDPTFEIGGVVHYCVANMPGAFPKTSTLALTNATLKYAADIANKGFNRAITEDRVLAKGLNTYLGKVTCMPVAEAHGLKYFPIEGIDIKKAS